MNKKYLVTFGTPRRMLDSSKLKGLGWTPKIDLRTGLQKAYNWYFQTLWKRQMT